MDHPLFLLALDSLLAFGLALGTVLAGGRTCIGWLARHCRETIRQDSQRLASLHAAKAATPTMGGLLILAGFLIALGLFADAANPEILVAVMLALGLAALGTWDDLSKPGTRRRGLSVKTKLAMQTLVAGIAVLWLMFQGRLDASWIELLGSLLLIVGLSNAVNLTDGLDGLAGGCSLIVLATMGLLAAVAASSASISLLCASLAGGVLGFLWFNRHPARVFMGDTGSLPLGGLIGLFVVLSENRLPLLLVCGVFLVEAASVVLQVGWFKYSGRRLFLCAPLHHHFQFLAWPEQKIVRRFWAAGMLCAAVAMIAAFIPQADVRIASQPHAAAPGATPMKLQPLRIVFAGGGTLGHLFPGLAVAAELKRLAPAIQIVFAGSGKAAEQRQVLLAGYEYVAVSSRPRPKRVRDSWAFVAENFRGLREAKQYLRINDVHAVVGLGGYASFAMARAAAGAGIPLILLEQNAVAGRATRRLAPHAGLICVAFDAARNALHAGGPIRVTGNPIRQAGGLIKQPQSLGGRRLLILGGSQGSESLNRAVPYALSRLQPDLAGWSVVHQTGELGAAATAGVYAELGLAAHVVPFIENLPRVMASCHLAISRAGGTTLAELSAAGLPAVAVPYPAASDNHQHRNAEEYATRGACVLIDGRHGPRSVEGQLVAALPELLLSDERRTQMAECMRKLARPAAAWHVARMVLDHAGCAQQLLKAA